MLRKRHLFTTIAFLLVIAMLAGCTPASQTPDGATATPAAGGEQATSTAEATTASQEDNLDGGMTNAQGLPLTKEEVTLTAAVMEVSHLPSRDQSKVWDYIRETTNLNIVVEPIKGQEKADLIFASRTFPDILMRLNASANLLDTAAEGGDLVELEPLLKDYAPTWYQFLQENRLVYNGSLLGDGKLYSLPFVEFAPYDRNLRDQWGIMKSWLDELGLEVPTTTEEFKNALIAIKDNAGKGSIPEEVVPYHFLFRSYIGGPFDIYGSFGVYATSGDYLYVDNGTVVNQSINPDIKEPLKYLRELYSLKLITPEIFTDDGATYNTKVNANPPMIASFGGYGCMTPEIGGTAMGPLDAENGKTPLMRAQTFTANPNHVAFITSNNPCPIATTRFFEMMASDTDMMMTVQRGTKGILWQDAADGKVEQIFWEDNLDLMQENLQEIGMHNSFIVLRDQKFYEEKWIEKSYDTVGTRAWNYENIYKNHVMPNDAVYIGGRLSQDDTLMMQQYSTDLSEYRDVTFSDFITGKKDIDAQWDAYVAEMNALGMDEFMRLKQAAYDVMVK